MNRPQTLSASNALIEDILAVAWSSHAALPATSAHRADFTAAIWQLEDALDNDRPTDAALIAVIQYVAVVTA